MSTRSPALPLLTLPPLQRKIIAHLMRTGPLDQSALLRALDLDVQGLQAALSALASSGYLCLHSNGTIEAQPGRTRRRTLPARLWPALQTASRLYSVQEIAALRTAIPIVQFARAKLGEFTDHGPGHILRVKLFATQLGYLLGLSATEHHLLRAAALFHDVGNVLDRARHHIISQETVEQLAALGQLPFSAGEAALIGLLCRWHRKEYEPLRTDQLRGETIRTGLAASILRIADALDSDYRRVDYGPKFRRVVEFFFPHEIPFVDDLATILGIRIRCTPALQLQLYVQEQTAIDASYHIKALYKDVSDTPLDCPITVLKAPPRSLPTLTYAQNGTGHWLPQRGAPRTLLVVPFDPHSLVMAALSYRQLQAAGHDVELLVYPDTSDATNWLWQSALLDFVPGDFAHLVVIGDRPTPQRSTLLTAEIIRWQQAGVTIALLNRHQANWVELPALLAQGVQSTLGGDWAYFWGDQADETDLFWGRIAALCTRDPMQSMVGVAADEEAISQGLLKVIYDTIATVGRQAGEDGEDWTAVAQPLLERISADDRTWFVDQATAFRTTYGQLPVAPTLHGKVLHFDLATTTQGHTLFWGLEQAIEGAGRLAERALGFRIPYALATWREPPGESAPAETIQLLAINHWREEEATPIRLLYPATSGPVPEGNESTLRVSLPAAQANALLAALIAACNEEERNFTRPLHP